LAIDGPGGSDSKSFALGVDTDFQVDTSTLTVLFDGFESAHHGVTRFEWAIGTSPGSEDVQPLREEGITHRERDDIPGNGTCSTIAG
jgi:hypothetical protein